MRIVRTICMWVEYRERSQSKGPPVRTDRRRNNKNNNNNEIHK